MTFDLRAWAARHGFNGEQAGEALGVDRATFYRYCTQPELPKWLVLACERLDDEWMPIESAPKDGTEILLYTAYGCIEGYWRYDEWEQSVMTTTYDMAYAKFECQPIYWKPLPPKPSTGAPKSQEK